MHRLMGRVHAGLVHALATARSEERGQGTVEYVGLVLLMAALGAAVVAAGGGTSGKDIALAVVTRLKETILAVGGK